MTTSRHIAHETPAQPSLSSLMARHLQKQAEAAAAGLLDEGSEVQLFEAGPVQPIDARPAWDEALAALTYLGNAPKPSKAPTGWPQLVAGHPPAIDLAFCVGNFPQLVRNLALLLQPGDLTARRSAANGSYASAPALVEWAVQKGPQAAFPQALLAVAALRLTGQFGQAERLIAAHEGQVPAEWRAIWQNEKAALLWHRGEVEAARQLWLQLPDSIPVLFNRGMAALFTGRRSEAVTALQEVSRQLPETSAWHHLASLYLTLAQ